MKRKRSFEWWPGNQVQPPLIAKDNVVTREIKCNYRPSVTCKVSRFQVLAQ